MDVDHCISAYAVGLHRAIPNTGSPLFAGVAIARQFNPSTFSLQHALELARHFPVECCLRVTRVGRGACRIATLDRGPIEFLLTHLLRKPRIGIAQLMTRVKQDDFSG